MYKPKQNVHRNANNNLDDKRKIGNIPPMASEAPKTTTHPFKQGPQRLISLKSFKFNPSPPLKHVNVP